MEPRAFTMAQLYMLVEDVYARARSEVEAEYADRIERLESTVAALRVRIWQQEARADVDKRGAVHIWLRFRPPPLETQAPLGWSATRTRVTVGAGEEYRVHRVFGRALEEGEGNEIDVSGATNDDVGAEWDSFVAANSTDGRSALLCAHGQTGAGKTETLIGQPSARCSPGSPRQSAYATIDFDDRSEGGRRIGLVPRTVLRLRALGFAVAVLAVQIYASGFFDVAGDAAGRGQGEELELETTDRATASQTVRFRYRNTDLGIAHPAYTPIENEQQLRDWLVRVDFGRIQADTAPGPAQASAAGVLEFNHTSSRSHLIVHITGVPSSASASASASTDSSPSSSKHLRPSFWIADLAGNEKPRKASPNTEREKRIQKEARDINSGLSSLKHIIQAIHRVAKKPLAARDDAWDKQRIKIRRNHVRMPFLVAAMLC